MRDIKKLLAAISIILLCFLLNQGLRSETRGVEHGQRYDRSGDQGRTPVTEEEKEHRDDQQGAFGQVSFDRSDGLVDQRGAVIQRGQLDTFRYRGLYLSQTSGRGLGDLAAVFSDQHEHCTKNDFLPVLRGRTGTQLVAQLDVGHILHGHMHTMALGKHE